MKREELEEIPMIGWECYDKEEADSVMDAMEKQIRTLENDKEEMYEANLVQQERIKELEAQCTKYQAELMNNDPALNPTVSKMETTESKWNSVKNGVPTHNRAVAIYPPFKGCEFACYNEFECCWDTEDGDDYLCDLDEVEKWFEIPLPPTTEEK